MSSNNSSTSIQADSWDQSNTSANAAHSNHRSKAKTKAVPDDWDADEEEEVDGEDVWRDANAKEPMPEIVLASSTAVASAVVPPSEALQAPMRILKRPTPQTRPSESSLSGAQSQKSLADREAEYQAARERIFASSSAAKEKDKSRSASPKTPAPQEPGVSVLRNPRGPTAGNAGTARGFGGKRGGKRGSKGKSSPDTPPMSTPAEPSGEVASS